MKFRSSVFALPATLLLLVSCGAEGPLVANTGGSSTTGGTASTAGSSGTATGGSAGSLAGAGGGSAGATASFGTLKSIIQMSCFGGLCHDLPEHPLQLKLDDKLYSTLTTHTTKHCGPLLKPGSPQDSAIVKLLKGPCGETARMPLDKCSQDGDEACVTPANIALIEQWISNGAPP